MDFRFTADELDYEAQVHDFLAAGVPGWWTGLFVLEEDAYRKAWEWSNGFARQLARENMLIPGWPEEHGGIALDPLKQLILAEQLAYSEIQRNVIATRGLGLAR